MRLFYWASKTFKEYGNGYLIAIGKDAEEARNLIRTQFKKEFFDNFLHLDINDPEDKDEIKEKYKEIETDLMKEPVLINEGAFIIRGSS